MSTVIIHADVQAHTVSEESVDVVNRDELAAILADYTLAAPFVSVNTTTFQPSLNVNLLLVTTSSTITLPSPTLAVNKVYNIKRLVRNGSVVINSSTGLIDGNGEVEITAQYASISVISDGVNWWIF
jgi:hypothetical protein